MDFTGFEEIEAWEGLRLKAYQDEGGVWTIGYGHTGPDVFKGLSITKEQANELLFKDLSWAEAAVDNKVKAKLNQNQHNALVSFVFNIGETAFYNSTCLRRLNKGDYLGAVDALTWFNKIDGKTSKGLVNRRAKEKALFLRPVGGTDPVPSDKEIEIRVVLEEFVKRLKEVMEK